jgi:quercetin dioxygenase-like cupin family protein
MEIAPRPPTGKGSAEIFTGDVLVDPITRALPPSLRNVTAVRAGPGARNAWPFPERGQAHCVTEGRGLVQVLGQNAVELHPGDVVFAPPGEGHGHGATSGALMTQLSISGGAARRGDHVTDDEYAGARPRKEAR